MEYTFSLDQEIEEKAEKRNDSVPKYQYGNDDIGRYYSKYRYDESRPYIERLKLENGKWYNSGTPYLYGDLDKMHVRTCEPVEVHAGDLIKIDSGNERYLHYVSVWKEISGETVKVRDDEEALCGNEEIRVAFNGWFTVSFRLPDDWSQEISVDEFNGAVHVIHDSYPHDMLIYDSEGIKKALSGQKRFSPNFRENKPCNNLATFVHVTDIHGDEATFRNAYSVAELLNADAFIATGDIVYYYSTDSIDFVNRTVENKKTDFLMCVGNHDGFMFDPKEQYSKFIEPFAQTYGYKLDTSVEYPTYYYKDYENRKLRVIVVNQFEYDGKTSMKDTRLNYTQEQIDFLVQVLLDTPEGFGVIIAMHAPEKVPVKDNRFPEFFQDKVLLPEVSNIALTPLADMVDAFISKGSICKTYSNLDGATPSSITVSADFTNAKEGTEFIAFLNGHYHADAVSYVPSTVNKQLCLNLTATNSWYGMAKSGISGDNNPYLTEFSDLARVGGTPTHDAFNVYSVDREDKSIRITRIGSNMPYKMNCPREYMVIPYADKES